MEIIKGSPIDYSDYHYTRNITIKYLIKCIFQSQYIFAFIRGLKQHKQKNPHKQKTTSNVSLVRCLTTLVVY